MLQLTYFSPSSTADYYESKAGLSGEGICWQLKENRE